MPTRASANRPTTIWIAADQCTSRNSALAEVDPKAAVIVMIESIAQARKPAYHQRKLVLTFAVMRHFAVDLRAAGWNVDYYAEHAEASDAFARHVERYAPDHVRLMQQSEWGVTEAMCAIAAAAGLRVTVTSHVNFVSAAADLDSLGKTASARVTMDVFYRHMRRKTGLLMDGREPAGGNWNYDAENRERPQAGLSFAPVPRFEPDAITRDVIAMVERRFGDHPGTIGDFCLAVGRHEALSLLEHFCTQRLDTYGPWQDAMVTGNPTMSHSLLSAAINTGLLDPLEVCERAELAYRNGTARLQSVEGFIRQIIGWREYIWRVYWKLMPAYRERNALGADLPLPEFYWTGQTQMFCLRTALETVRETAYAHHIVRLMVLGNFALLAGFDPIETNDWFWAMFIDGYDWVMVPNVIGMSLHADGGYVGTKPYCASANYINKMSNYCGSCRYDHKAVETDDGCPFNALYWDFLARNEARFSHNHRMAMMLRNWQRRPGSERAAIRVRAARIREALRRGDAL
jgi:deoxyribodipyrimidine photolyase-related protein